VALPLNKVKEYNDTMKPRPSSRDRHGRGIRHSLSGALYRTGGSSQDQFASIVSSTCDYLKERWPVELGSLKYQILDAPILGVNSTYVKRWAARPETMTIIIYRLPILRLDQNPNSSPTEERVRIEHHVFEAAGELIGKEPWELIFGDEPEN
jgi:hypothetical protein